MTISVNISKKSPRVRDRNVSMIAKWSPTLKKRILPVKNPVLWRANKCEGEKQTKQKEPWCVHISFKVVTYLGHYNVNSYVNSPKTVFPLSATLTLVKKIVISILGKSVLYFPLLLTQQKIIITLSEHNANSIFKKRSMDLVKARCRESNTSRQLCFLLKEVRVILP